jgi:D-threo-aldose 1-dehydrogenase
MTRLGLGGARLGSSARGAGWRESVRLVHAAVDHGVLYFDTADAYGGGASELVLGRALRGHRSKVTIATKGGYVFVERGAVRHAVHAAGKTVVRWFRPAIPDAARRAVTGSVYRAQDFSTAYLTIALEGSLRRLATDHIDVYQLHGPAHADADADAVGEWAATMVSRGKIGCLGIGAETVDQARTWLPCSSIASVQVPFGLLDVDAGTDVIPRAHASGRAVVARGVFGAGLLADPSCAGPDNADKLPLIDALRSVAARAGIAVNELAIDFVRARPDVDVMLVGTRSPQHLGEVATRMGSPLLDAELLATIEPTLAAHRREDL